MDSQKKICVLGLGYIGLPTASILASAGHKVVGVDTNLEVVKVLQNHGLHIHEPGLRELVGKVTSSGDLSFSPTPQLADTFILAVPTPMGRNRSADLQYVKSATRSILPYLREGNMVILESTVPPGTVERVVLPILSESGLDVGSDIFVAHSPERVLPGRILVELVENNRIVGGIDEESTRRAHDLYASFVEGKILCTDCTTAEMVKLIENTFRDINIAYANELAKICESIGINVWEAIELANYHPRVNVHKPGPGVGGHCIAIDPWFIVEVAPELAKLISLGRLTNDLMPTHVVRTVNTIVPPESKIAVLGLAFKGDVDDVRESPAICIVDKLEKQGYEVEVYDPYVKVFRGREIDDLQGAVENSDLVLVLTDHSDFKEVDVQSIADLVNTRRVFDTKNCLDREVWESARFIYYLLGDGKSRFSEFPVEQEAAIAIEVEVSPGES